MKKKITICLVVLLLIVATAVVCMVKFSNKDQNLLNQFNRALKNEKSMEKFIEKNIDFRTACAYYKVFSYTEYPIDEKELSEKAERIKDSLTEEEIEEYKQEKMEQYKEYCSEENEKYSKISKESEIPQGPALKVRTVTSNNESTTMTFDFFHFYYYDGKLIDIIKNHSTTYTSKEIEVYNSKVNCYVSEQAKGTDIKLLIDEIIFLDQANAEEQGEFIGIKVKENSISNYESNEELFNACQKANIYDFDDGSIISASANSEENITKATTEMTKLKSKINSQKKYSVKAFAYKGKIVWIYIEGPDADK